MAVNDGDRRLRLRRLIRAVAIGLAVYLVAYAALSRYGMARAKAVGFTGWYFVEPRKDAPSRYYLNLGCVIAFGPLILLERTLGTVDWPACSEPLRSLPGGR